MELEEGVSERSEAVPTAPTIIPNLLNLNSLANTIAAYTIPIIALTIANLTIIT